MEEVGVGFRLIFLVGLFAVAGLVALVVLLLLWLTRKRRDADAGRLQERD